jgi:RNA polymerase sigma-B factor
METRLIIDRAVARLEESERRLIWLRFFEQRSQSDIADELGISQMQVSRLLTRLLLKLRSMIGDPENVAAAS